MCKALDSMAGITAKFLQWNLKYRRPNGELMNVAPGQKAHKQNTVVVYCLELIGTKLISFLHQPLL